jgi:DNA-binding winged helix-turn-helix (wHTH) protein/TolB-like protein
LSKPQEYRIGDWTLDLGDSRLKRGDLAHRLEPLELAVLLHLTEHAPSAVTAEQLLERNWRGVVVADGAVHRVIASLRKALGDDARQSAYIETLSKRGYRLVVPVSSQNEEHNRTQSSRRFKITRNGLVAGLVVIPVGAVVATMLVIWLTGNGWPLTTISLQCFNNLSESKYDYIAHGLAEEIRVALSRREFVVVSPGRSKAACTSGESIKGVGSVLEGSVRVTDHQVQIVAHLVNANDDRVELSERYSGELADLFVIADQIATNIAEELLGDPPSVEVVRSPVWEASQLFLRARFQLRRRGVEPIQRAIRLFQDAIARDPAYGRAYQGLAEAFAVAPSYTVGPPEPFIEMSLAALDKAEELGGTDSHADAIRGFIHQHNLEWESAHNAFESAMVGEPDDSDLLQWHSQFRASLGYLDHALELAEKSVSGDPLSPPAHQRLAVMYVWHDDVDGAAEQFRIAEELGLTPEVNVRARFPMLLRQGLLDQARVFYESIFSELGLPIDWIKPWIAHIQHGTPAAPAVAALKEAYHSGRLPPRIYVGALYYLDDADALFEAIDRVLSEGWLALDYEMWFVRDGRVLQNDPRFPLLLERLEIIAYWDAHGWPSGCRRVDELIQCGPATQTSRGAISEGS